MEKINKNEIIHGDIHVLDEKGEIAGIRSGTGESLKMLAEKINEIVDFCNDVGKTLEAMNKQIINDAIN